MAILVSSCSSDDNGGETLAPLQGKWLLSQTGSVVNGEEQLIDAGANEGCDRDYMDLRVSNAVIFGDISSVGGECSATTTEGTYVRSHNNLTTTVGGVSVTQDIVNLTLKELKLRNSVGVITVYKR